MKNFLRMLAVVSALALVAVACGSGDSSGLPGQSAPPSNAAAEENDDAGGGDGGGDSNDIELPVDVGDIPGLSGDCEAIANVFLSMTAVFLGGDVAEADLGAFGGLPGDLRDDAAIVVGALNDFYAELDSLGLDLSDPASLASLSADQATVFAEIGESLDTEEFNEAADNLSDYAEAECGQFAPG